MARIEEHCEDCKKFLKNEMREVHEFLDIYAKQFPIGHFVDYYRTFLHNSYGLHIVTDQWGHMGWCAAMLHLTRDYVEGTIDHWTFEGMTKEFPRRLMWFNKMTHAYEPQPHIVRAWGGKSLVYLSQ